MYKYEDLECSILSCFFLKPELMEQTKLEDKHFKNYYRVWRFMKAFYKKYNNFDLTLMCSVCKNRWKFMQYVIDIFEQEPTASRFKEYEEQLIYLYNEDEKDKWIIKKIYQKTCDLWVRNITTEEFKRQVDYIYQQANKIFD